MKLRSLNLLRSKGLDAPIALDDLSPGFNVIVGPNGSGKSSLCRAITGLLWETKDFQGAVSATWTIAGKERTCQRESGAPPLWDGTPSPALPNSVYRGCFSFCVDDFLTDTATDGEIQRVIRTELSAGFDLSRVLADRKRYGASHGAVTTRKSELVVAGRKVEDVRRAHGELLSQELSLAELRERRQESARAIDRKGLFKEALELATKRVELRDANAIIAAFPAEMSQLRGDEARLNDKLVSALSENDQALSKEKQAVAAAQKELASTGLEQEVLSADLQILLERETELRELEQQFKQAQGEEAKAVASIEQARRILRQSGGPLNAAKFDESDWQQLEALLYELQQHDAKRAEKEIQAASAPGATNGADLGAVEAPYAEGMTLLSRWLSAAGEKQAKRARLTTASVLAAGLILIVVTFAAPASTPFLLTIAFALLMLGTWRFSLTARDSRSAWQRDYLSLPLGPPSEWEPTEVAQRLVQLQAESKAWEARKLAQDRARDARRELGAIEQQRRTVAAHLDELALAVGLAPETARMGFVRIASELKQNSEAEHGLVQAQAKKEDAKSRLAHLLCKVNELLNHYGLESARDAVEVRCRKDALSTLDSTRRQATKAQQEASARLDGLTRKREQAKAEYQAFLEERGLAHLDEAAFGQRLQQQKEWSQAMQTCKSLSAEIARLEKRLEDHTELVDLGVEAAQEALSDNEELAKLSEQLNSDVAKIENAIAEARSGHRLEEALSKEQEARDNLAETREELFESAAADFLLDNVARDHSSLAQPDLLQEVGRLFAQFTRHRYELRTAPYSEGPASAGESLPFEIHESEGAQKALSELSSGTKSQLGLALRIAVAKSVEVGEELPFVLDEALTNSDPERFRDVVRSLVDLARAGRQILFLTADDTDAERLEAVLREEGIEDSRRYELSETRSEARKSPNVEAKRLPKIPQPKPGETHGAYAKRLRVPRIDPFGGIEAMHVFYVCSDDLDGLYEILCERVETIGRTRSLLAADASVWPSERRARFEVLCNVSAAFLEHYRVGRTPRLVPEVLREGPTGTTKYIETLVTMNEEFHGDARALLAELEVKSKDRDARLKGFKRQKLDELKRDLAERELFTEDEPRSSAERLERCLAAAREGLEKQIVRREDIVQLANSLEQWLE